MNVDQTLLQNESLEQREGIWFARHIPPISYPEEANSVYYEVEDASFWFLHRNKCITSLAKTFAIATPFYDIGGGNGFVSLGMQQAGFNSVLIEPGYFGCLNGKRRGVKNIICATIENSGIKQGSMPSCGLFDVVEHIEDDIGFLKNVHKFMAVGGKLILTVPAYNLLWSQEDKYIGHYRRYTLRSISKALNKAGFKIEYKTYLFSFLVLPILIFRSLPTWFGIHSKRGDPETVKKDHGKQGAFNKYIFRFLQWESNKVRQLKRIPFGSSCLIVATKE